MQEAFVRHTSKARHTSLAFSVGVAPEQRQSPIIALVHPLGEREIKASIPRRIRS